jgi:hypothetical protein
MSGARPILDGFREGPGRTRAVTKDQGRDHVGSNRCCRTVYRLLGQGSVEIPRHGRRRRAANDENRGNDRVRTHSRLEGERAER